MEAKCQPMLSPSTEQMAVLGPFEKAAFTICDRANRWPFAKRLGHLYLRHFGALWVHVCTRNLLRVYGLRHLPSERPDRGVVVVSNHRSFFDLYVVSSVLLRHAPWIEQMYFPVRSKFFYERPDGVAVNAIMSALAMYPPIVRDASKRAFNKYSIELLSQLARVPGTVVGVHPEGTRNKTDDPYSLLPAQPGIGQLVYEARPVVLPAFVLGLGNDFVRQVHSNFDGTGEPVTLVFGEPLDLREYWNEPPRLRTYMRVAERLRAEIMKLGERERALRSWEGFPDRSAHVADSQQAA